MALKKPGVPHRGGRPAPVPIGGRSSRPPAEREALNLVLDVLAQLLEDAFDVIGRAVIGKRPTPAGLCGRLALVGEHCPQCHHLTVNPDQRIGVDAHRVAPLDLVIEYLVLYSANAGNRFFNLSCHSFGFFAVGSSVRSPPC